ncbi:hypothetical protein PENSPDRAFT_108802 [Peniophora sp. CONT]|nr:hypothetical protein PENSPDRAFT_108802 [Peniophora sp. CONT]
MPLQPGIQHGALSGPQGVFLPPIFVLPTQTSLGPQGEGTPSSLPVIRGALPVGFHTTLYENTCISRPPLLYCAIRAASSRPLRSLNLSAQGRTSGAYDTQLLAACEPCPSDILSALHRQHGHSARMKSHMCRTYFIGRLEEKNQPCLQARPIRTYTRGRPS